MFTSPIYTPTKRIFNCNDEFFTEGNIALRAYWLERDASTQLDASMIREEASTLSTTYNDRPIFCELPSCIQHHGHPVSFPSLVAYESHYEALHRNTCSICNLSFPGAHWLALHLDEQHNVLNQIRKDRGDKIYECYVETCTKRFISPKMRRLHLIDMHGYPKFFPFDIVVTGTMSIERRQQRLEQHHRRRIRLEQKQHSLNATPKEDGKENTLEDNSNHAALPTEASDMDVDVLAAGFARMKIPATISFGRGSKQVWNRKQHYGSPAKKAQHKNNEATATGTSNKKAQEGMKMDEAKPNRRARRLAAAETTKTSMDLE